MLGIRDRPCMGATSDTFHCLCKHTYQIAPLSSLQAHLVRNEVDFEYLLGLPEDEIHGFLMKRASKLESVSNMPASTFRMHSRSDGGSVPEGAGGQITRACSTHDAGPSGGPSADGSVPAGSRTTSAYHYHAVASGLAEVATNLSKVREGVHACP